MIDKLEKKIQFVVKENGIQKEKTNFMRICSEIKKFRKKRNEKIREMRKTINI